MSEQKPVNILKQPDMGINGEIAKIGNLARLPELANILRTPDSFHNFINGAQAFKGGFIGRAFNAAQALMATWDMQRGIKGF